MTTSAAPATGNEVLKGEKKGVDILLTNAIASVAHTADMTSTMSQLEISLREGADRAAKKCQREIDDVQLQKRRLDEEIAEWRRCAARAMRDREREEKEMSEKMKGVNCEIEKCQALEKSLAEKEVEVEREREIVFQKRGCVRREIERLAEREQRLKSLFAKVRDSGGGCDGGGEIGRLRERLKRAEEIVRRNGLYGQVDEGVTKVDRGMFALEVGAKEGEDVEGVRRKRRRLDRRSVSGRGGGGLTGFVASRQAVQKPCGGVGQTRRGDVWTKKTSGTS